MRIFSLLFFSLTVLVVACNKSPNTIPDDPNNPDPNPDPNPNPVTGCKQCNYYPVCDGSYFTYIDSAYPAASVTYTDTLRAEADTIINGLVYKKVKRISTRYPSTEYINCQNGVYRIGGKYAMGSKPIILLKTNEPVGATWTDNASTGVSLVFTIMAKDMSMTINSINYTEVIKVKFTIQGSGSAYTAYYYFAKGIGIIQFEYGEWNGDPNWYHRNYLQHYFIP